jgi:hypothetical protein
MNYRKPEVNSLGKASRVIEYLTQQKAIDHGDGGVFSKPPNPAYELDE